MWTEQGSDEQVKVHAMVMPEDHLCMTWMEQKSDGHVEGPQER